MTGVYATAREFLERQWSKADARNDRTLARLIAQRLCEVIEQEDFDERRRKDDPTQWAETITTCETTKRSGLDSSHSTNSEA